MNGPIKKLYKKALERNRTATEGFKLTKSNFAQLIELVCEEAQPRWIINAFATTGLYPFTYENCKLPTVVKHSTKISTSHVSSPQLSQPWTSFENDVLPAYAMSEDTIDQFTGLLTQPGDLPYNDPIFLSEPAVTVSDKISTLSQNATSSNCTNRLGNPSSAAIHANQASMAENFEVSTTELIAPAGGTCEPFHLISVSSDTAMSTSVAVKDNIEPSLLESEASPKDQESVVAIIISPKQAFKIESYWKSSDRYLIDTPFSKFKELIGVDKVRQFEDPNFLAELENLRTLHQTYQMLKTFDLERKKPLELPKPQKPLRKGTRTFKNKRDNYVLTTNENLSQLEERYNIKMEKETKKRGKLLQQRNDQNAIEKKTKKNEPKKCKT